MAIEQVKTINELERLADLSDTNALAVSTGNTTGSATILQLKTWLKQQIVDATAVKAGTIIAWAATTPPEGYLICDGSAISRETYADLYSVIGTTYGEGDGESTFNLPNATGKSVYQTASGNIGNGGRGTLPNITAGVASNQNTLGAPGAAAIGTFGAMKVVGNSDDNSRFQIGGLAGWLKRATFDASLVSDCYATGATTVVPSAIYIKFAIKY